MSVARFTADQRTLYRVPVALTCALLGVSVSWLHKWLERAESRAAVSGLFTSRERRRDTIDRAVVVAFKKARGLHGSPRLHVDLLADGWGVSEKTVADSMRRQGLIARRIRRRSGLTRQDKTAPKFPDLVKRQFHAPAQDQRWVGDITEIPTGVEQNNGRGQKLYLATVIDLYSRPLLGAATSGDETAVVPIGRATAATFRQLDDPWGLSAILYHLGWGLRQFGRYDEGSRVLEEAIDVATGAGLYNTVQWALADLAIAQLHLGDEDTARGLFDRASAASEHVGDGAGAVLAGYGHALIAQAAGKWDLAQDHFAEAYVGFGELATPVPQGLALAGLARRDEAAGEATAARKRYDELLELGRRVGEPGLTTTAVEGLCRLAVERGDRTLASTLLAEAAQLRTSSARPAPPHERRHLAAVIVDLAPAPVPSI